MKRATTQTQQVGADLAGVEGRDQDVLGGPAEHPRVGHGEHPEEHGSRAWRP